MSTETTRALVIVDVQNDFCEGGSLAVAGGAQVAADLGGLIAQAGYDHVVATRDAHIDPGAHFSDTPDFVDSWPRHCVVGTPGAEFHPNLATEAIEAVFDKGNYEAAYSGFEGAAADGAALEAWLRDAGVQQVDVVGIATDYCVKATALDAAKAGFSTRVLTAYTAGVAPESTVTALDDLRAAGIEVVAD